MIKKKALTMILVFVAMLFIAGNALRNAWLPHVKTAIITSGSIPYTFPGWDVIETDDQKYILETDLVYADCFTIGSQPRWIPYSDTETVQLLRVIMSEVTNSSCIVTMESTWLPGTVIIQNGSIQVDSPLYPALVPRISFVSEDTIYIMKENYSSGKKEDIVATCRVKTAPGNDQYIPCIAGVVAGTQVLVAWDRPLVVGGNVEIVSSVRID